MSTIGGRDIFICNSVKKIEKMFDTIVACLDNPCSDNTSSRSLDYKIIDDTEMQKRILEEKFDEVRFACVTDETQSNTINILYENCIPILLIDSGSQDSRLKEYLREIVFRTDKGDFNRMIYKLEQPDQITGAINWVHTFFWRFFDIREKEATNKSYQDAKRHDEFTTAQILEQILLWRTNGA